ncbi:MAG: hypothetical protein IPP42_09970 [Saprospiraceae bacterium]|nr:hypothetical protein [Saprospiraceae bacterium]
MTFLFASCRNHESISSSILEDDAIYPVVTSEFFLKGTEIELKVGRIKNMFILKDKLLISEIKGNNILLSYSLIDNSITEFGHIGEGPENLTTPEFTKVVNIVENEESVIIFDFLTKSLYKLSLSDHSLNKIYDGKFDDATIQSMNLIGDSIVVFVGGRSSSLKFLNIKSNTSVSTVLKNPFNRPLEDHEIQKININDFGFNVTHNYGYTWNLINNYLDIYSTEGEILKSFQFGENKNIIKDKIIRKYAYYYKANSYKDFIYGLYGGFELNDQFLNMINISHLKSEVHIYNFNEPTLKRYILDRIVNTCAIDFKNNVIYCIQEGGNEDKPLVKYEMEN